MEVSNSAFLLVSIANWLGNQQLEMLTWLFTSIFNTDSEFSFKNSTQLAHQGVVTCCKSFQNFTCLGLNSLLELLRQEKPNEG